MSSKDTDFLKQRVTAAAQTPQVSDTTTSTSTIDTANTFLENVTADEPEVLSPRQKRLKRIAESQGANDPERAAKVQAEEEQQQAIDAQDEQQESSVNISDRASRVVTSASESINPLIDKVGSLPTVGGIGLLVLILVILLFTVVQVNDQGDTRLKQLWYMLNGRATIKGRQTVEAAIPGTGNTIIPGGGVSGNFGNTPPATGGGGPDLTHASTDLGF